jgi:hypothetical protein
MAAQLASAVAVVVAVVLAVLAVLAGQVPPVEGLAEAEAEAELLLLEIRLLLGWQPGLGMALLRKKFYVTWFDPDTHQIDVYFTRSKLIRPIRIEIPVVDGLYPEGDDLENYIMSFEPMDNITREVIPRASNPDHIQDLLVTSHKLSATEIYAKKSAIQKRNTLLYLSDWTQLSDVQETFDAEEKLRWKDYRQKLRDITSQSGWPLAIDWPKQPFVFGVTAYE